MRHSSFFSSAQAQRLALAVEAQAVGPPAGLQEGREFAVDAPLQDAVVRLVGEEDVALPIRGRALGELEAAGEFLQLVPGEDAGLRPRQFLEVDVAKPEFRTVVLQQEGAPLAALDRVHGQVVHDQLAVQMHRHVLADQLDLERVPLADRIVGADQRLVRMRLVVPQAAGAFLVVPDLDLGCTAEEHAAVAAFGNLPVDVKDEVLVFFDRHEVTRLAVIVQDAILDFPVFGRAGVSLPVRQILAVEQGGEAVRRCVRFGRFGRQDRGLGHEHDHNRPPDDTSTHGWSPQVGEHTAG